MIVLPRFGLPQALRSWSDGHASGTLAAPTTGSSAFLNSSIVSALFLVLLAEEWFVL